MFSFFLKEVCRCAFCKWPHVVFSALIAQSLRCKTDTCKAFPQCVFAREPACWPFGQNICHRNDTYALSRPYESFRAVWGFQSSGIPCHKICKASLWIRCGSWCVRSNTVSVLFSCIFRIPRPAIKTKKNVTICRSFCEIDHKMKKVKPQFVDVKPFRAGLMYGRICSDSRNRSK